MRRFTLALITLLALAACDNGKGGDAPLVQDDANILSAQEENALHEYHAKLQEEFGIDFRVVTTSDPADINIFAFTYFKEHSIGAKGKDGRGLLLVVNTAQNLVRLEVATVLEPVYTDAFISYIEHRQMIPFFKAAQVTNGILATTELIFARAIKGTNGQEFSESEISGSMGAGATNEVEIGDGAEEKSSATIAAPDGLNPAQVVATYLQAMAQRNNSSVLPIFSRDTMEMQKNWVVTAAQMDMVASTYKSCAMDAAHIDGSYAVVRYPVNKRTCAPYFLVKEDGAWKLDLTMMMKGIRFNHRNEWHFDLRTSHPYGFAFKDWRFDINGYPHE